MENGVPQLSKSKNVSARPRITPSSPYDKREKREFYSNLPGRGFTFSVLSERLKPDR